MMKLRMMKLPLYFLLVVMLALPAYAQQSGAQPVTPPAVGNAASTNDSAQIPAKGPSLYEQQMNAATTSASGARPVILAQPEAILAPRNFDVRPDEVYEKPTWLNLIHTMIRAGTIVIDKDNDLLDEYAQIAECDLYANYYHDDFQWNKVRKGLLEVIARDKDSYPMRYHYDTELQLDRYDFANKYFKFRERSIINRANIFRLYASEGDPCAGTIRYLPRSYSAHIDDSITITGIPLASGDAETLLHYLDVAGNTDHILYVSFDLTLKYIMPLRREVRDVTTGKVAYYQEKDSSRDLRMDAKLDRVRFYADADRKLLIYTLKP